MLGIVAVLIVLGGVFGFLALRPKVFDATALNSTISQQYKEKFGGSTIVVNCPDNQKVAKGETFTCDIQGRSQEKIQVTVVVRRRRLHLAADRVLARLALRLSSAAPTAAG